MVNLENLNKDLTEIADKRIALSELNYDDEHYDLLEEELHDLEDGFLKKYDDFLEDIFMNLHDEFSPDTEIFSPLAYLAKNYIRKAENLYEVSDEQGVWMEVEKIPSKEAYLVLLPQPLRIMLMANGFKKIVWQVA
ncbi:MAG: hypothetical protein SFU27_02760 [Thermonemataceae bacterium]|nr:hypothetical protein [Thermonemataceae bacterium]